MPKGMQVRFLSPVRMVGNRLARSPSGKRVRVVRPCWVRFPGSPLRGRRNALMHSARRSEKRRPPRNNGGLAEPGLLRPSRKRCGVTPTGVRIPPSPPLVGWQSLAYRTRLESERGKPPGVRIPLPPLGSNSTSTDQFRHGSVAQRQSTRLLIGGSRFRNSPGLPSNKPSKLNRSSTGLLIRELGVRVPSAALAG